MDKIVFALVVSLLVAPVEVLAQHSIVNGCQDCTISQRTDLSTSLVGVFREAAAREPARLTLLVPQPPPQQRRSWVGRHPVLAGTLIGAGAGFGFGAAIVGGDEGFIDFRWWQGGYLWP